MKLIISLILILILFLIIVYIKRPNIIYMFIFDNKMYRNYIFILKNINNFTYVYSEKINIKTSDNTEIMHVFKYGFYEITLIENGNCIYIKDDGNYDGKYDPLEYIFSPYYEKQDKKIYNLLIKRLPKH